MTFRQHGTLSMSFVVAADDSHDTVEATTIPAATPKLFLGITPPSAHLQEDHANDRSRSSSFSEQSRLVIEGPEGNHGHLLPATVAQSERKQQRERRKPQGLFNTTRQRLSSLLPRMQSPGFFSNFFRTPDSDDHEDSIVTCILYFIHVREDQTRDGVWAFVGSELKDYSFKGSGVFVMLTCLGRNAILWVTYAYRFQTNPYSLYVSSFVTLFSICFVGLKVLLQNNSSIVPLLVWSLCFTAGQYILFLLVRRKRITAPTEIGPPATNIKLSRSPQPHMPSYQALSESAPPPHQSVAEDDEYKVEDGLSFRDLDSKFATVDRLSIHYKRHGDSDVGFMFIHGFGGSSFSWMQAWDELCEGRPAGTSLLAYDRPGFGLSSRPTHGDWVENPYTPEYEVELVLRMMNIAKLRQVILVGHSSGGAIAMKASVYAPDKVKGLFLVSPQVFTEGFPALVKSLFRTQLGKTMVKQLVRTELGEVTLRRAWFEPSRIPQAVIQNHKRSMQIRGWDEALMEMANVEPIQLHADLGKMKCPIAIMHGLDDKLVDISESQRLLLGLEDQHARTEWIPVDRCGHVPHQEIPGPFCEHLFRFTKSYGLLFDTADNEQPLDTGNEDSQEDEVSIHVEEKML